jgi:hypothetical protein
MAVQRYLKGGGGPTLELLTFEGYMVGSGQPTEEQAAQARLCEQHFAAQQNALTVPLPLQSGIHYLLFLNSIYHLRGRAYWLGTVREVPTAESIVQVEERLRTAHSPVVTPTVYR